MKSIREVLDGHPGLSHVAAGQVGGMALGAIFWFIMARLLKPEAYGNVNWLISLAMFVSAFCVLGWGKTIATYYPKEGKDELLGGATLIVLVASLAAGIGIGIFLEPLAGLLVLGLSLFSITLNSELGKRRYSRFKWIWIGTKLISLPISVIMYFWLGLIGVLAGYAIPHLVFGSLSLKYIEKSNPGLREAGEKLYFALKSFGVNTARSSTNLLDKILIGPIFGMAVLGIYQLAYQIFMALSVLPMVLFSYLLPEKSAGTKTEKIEVLGIITSVILAALSIGLSPLVIPYLFPGFAGSVKLVQIMSLGVIPFTITATKMSDLYSAERPGSVLVSHLIALAAGVVGILLLGNLFGAIGLATSMVILQMTLASLLIFFERR